MGQSSKKQAQRTSLGKLPSAKTATPRPLSEVFLEFIDPVLEGLGHPEPDSNEFREAVIVGIVIWNSVSFSETGDKTFLKQVQATVPEPMSAVTDFLLERRRREYAADIRLMGNWSVIRNRSGEFSFRVETRGK